MYQFCDSIVETKWFNMKVDYPKEWDELPKKERKKKIRELKKQTKKKKETFSKVKNIAIVLVVGGAIVFGYKLLTTKSPEEVAFEEEVEEVSLEGRVEESEIEGREHVSADDEVSYDTNPPTSGGHLAEAEGWGVYGEEIDDKAAVHSLEHGGIWISYKDISEEEISVLEEIARENSQSVIVSPRSENDDKIAVVSWGKMMRMETPDKALIQKYIDTYKNQSPERLAR
jgi:hypothetical protein